MRVPGRALYTSGAGGALSAVTDLLHLAPGDIPLGPLAPLEAPIPVKEDTPLFDRPICIPSLRPLIPLIPILLRTTEG